MSSEFANLKMIDIGGLSWGVAPVPILPASLRKLWQDEPLPSWLVAECGLPARATIETLGPEFWNRSSYVSPRLEHFVEFLIKSRVKTIEPIALFEQPWPVGLEIADIPFSSRAANALRGSGLIADKESLAQVTFGQLIAIPSVGIKSLIEISTLIEAALDAHWRLTEELARSFATPSDYAGTAAPIDSKMPSDAVRSDASASMEGWREILTAALENPWIDQVNEHDRRLGKFFPPGSGTLEDRIERAISDPAAYSSEIPGLLESLPRIAAAIERMEAQPLEDYLLELLSAYLGEDEPRLSAIAARFGWRGDDQKTLQECGDMLGVTRERLRQIESKIFNKLTKYPLYLPNLDSALDILEGSAPSHISRAAMVLVEKGVCRSPFSPRSLIQTAKMFGRNTSVEVEDHRGEELVVSREQGQALGILYRAARRLTGQSGVTSVYKVMDAITESIAPLDSPDIDESDVRRILADQPACEFLDEDWFWFTAIPEGRNRLENLIKKMLSVASPQSVASLREGVRRSFRWRAATNKRFRTLAVPPQNVLAKFLDRHPDFHLNGELVSAVKPLDCRKFLGEGEQVLVDVLRGISSGVMDRKTLITECLARGINENTLAVYTSYSPILDHIGVSLWQLRGVRVDPAAVEAVRQQNSLRTPQNRVQDFGWTKDCKLWVAWTLPSITSSRVFGIPGPIKRYLSARSFDAQPKDLERPLGRISITDEGTSYGYAPFLRYSGADEGDTLKAEFDLAAAKVQLSVNEFAFEDEESV